jgi:hypothetical protein
MNLLRGDGEIEPNRSAQLKQKEAWNNAGMFVLGHTKYRYRTAHESTVYASTMVCLGKLV